MPAGFKVEYFLKISSLFGQFTVVIPSGLLSFLYTLRLTSVGWPKNFAPEQILFTSASGRARQEEKP